MKKKKAHKEPARPAGGFKAVEFMRKRRDELSDLYESNPAEFWKQLEEVRKKYKDKFHLKKKPYKTKQSPSIAAEPKEQYNTAKNKKQD